MAGKQTSTPVTLGHGAAGLQVPVLDNAVHSVAAPTISAGGGEVMFHGASGGGPEGQGMSTGAHLARLGGVCGVSDDAVGPPHFATGDGDESDEANDVVNRLISEDDGIGEEEEVDDKEGEDEEGSGAGEEDLEDNDDIENEELGDGEEAEWEEAADVAAILGREIWIDGSNNVTDAELERELEAL